MLTATATTSPASLRERPTGRDRYVDFLRALSLLVVVGWHWIFSIVTWHPGPGSTSAQACAVTVSTVFSSASRSTSMRRGTVAEGIAIAAPDALAPCAHGLMLA